MKAVFIPLLTIALLGCAHSADYDLADWEHISYAHDPCAQAPDPALCLHDLRLEEEMRGHHRRSGRR